MEIKDAVASDLRGHDYIKARGLTMKPLYEPQGTHPPHLSNITDREYFQRHRTLPEASIEKLLNLLDDYSNDLSDNEGYLVDYRGDLANIQEELSNALQDIATLEILNENLEEEIRKLKEG